MPTAAGLSSMTLTAKTRSLLSMLRAYRIYDIGRRYIAAPLKPARTREDSWMNEESGRHAGETSGRHDYRVHMDLSRNPTVEAVVS